MKFFTIKSLSILIIFISTLNADVFRVKDNYIILQTAGRTYVGNEADQTYSINPYFVQSGDTITIIDQEGNNRIELVGGLSISYSTAVSDELQLNLTNGAVINIRGADTFKYDIGANKAAAIEGEVNDFSSLLINNLKLYELPSDDKPLVYGGSQDIEYFKSVIVNPYGDVTINPYDSVESFTKVVSSFDVTKLFVSILNRVPDSEGLDYWMNAAMSMMEIAKSFFEQPEAQDLYPSDLSNSDFITSVYQNIFNRDPDSAGLDYWKQQLDDALISRDAFIITIMDSARDDDIEIIDQKTREALDSLNN